MHGCTAYGRGPVPVGVGPVLYMLLRGHLVCAVDDEPYGGASPGSTLPCLAQLSWVGRGGPCPILVVVSAYK